MRGLLFAFMLSLLMPSLLHADGEAPQYLTGCCPNEVLGEGASSYDISAYVAQRRDLCGDDPEAPTMPCLVESTVRGGTGCCYPVGSYTTDSDRRAYASLYLEDCGSWPDAPPLSPCTESRPGGDILGEGSGGLPPPAIVGLPPLGPAENPALFGGLIMLSIVFVAVSYAVSYSIQNPSAIAWSKEQLREVIVGVVICIIVYGASITADGLISGATGYSDARELGSAALDPIIANIDAIYIKVAEAYFAVSIQQGASLGYVVGNLGYMTYSESRLPLSGVSPLLGALNNAASQLTMQTLSFKLVKVLLAYISTAVPSFFLPLGVIFRVFPFTKKLGNTLIALSLGALFMLPASLFVVKEMYGLAEMPHVLRAKTIDFDTKVSPWMNSGTIAGVRAFCENTALRLPTELGEWFWGPIYATVMAATCTVGYYACWIAYLETFLFSIWPFLMFVIQNTASILVSAAASDTSGIANSTYSASILPIVSILLPAVSEINTFSMVAVIIIAVFTFSGTKAISAALGGEYMLYGISRLV